MLKETLYPREPAQASIAAAAGSVRLPGMGAATNDAGFLEGLDGHRHDQALDLEAVLDHLARCSN